MHVSAERQCRARVYVSHTWSRTTHMLTVPIFPTNITITWGTPWSTWITGWIRKFLLILLTRFDKIE